METFTFEELRTRLENLIQVLKVLLRHSEDKTQLATFLSTISCQWQEPEMQMVKFKTKPNIRSSFECYILDISIIDLYDVAMKCPLQDEVGVGISLQNQLAALRETERGLLAYNCYVKCAKSELSLTLPTIMVKLLIN